jgi:diacylglycerol O-acyltransferase / wax synthase
MGRYDVGELTAPRRVDTVDTTWLHMDDPANLMMVTIVLMFDPPLAYEQLRQLIETRLLAIPRFRQRIVERRGSGFGVRLDEGNASWVGAPYWEEDPHLDIDQHLEVKALDGPDEEASLRRLVSAAMSHPLDPLRPLWHVHFVPHYRAGSAIVVRVHHCIGDGFALTRALLSMADNPEALAAQMTPTGGTARTRSWLDAAGYALTGATTVLKLTLMGFDRRTSLKGPLAVEKRATWSNRVPLDRVKAASRTLNVSINDMLLAAVTGALRRHLLSQGPVPRSLNVRCVVPVNLRNGEDAESLGNRFGLAFVALPVGMGGAERRLAEVRRRTQALKQSQEPMVTFQVLSALGLAPRWLFDPVLTFFGRKASGVATNVIGPREPVTFAGAKMDQAMFWVPCAARLGLGISILSYAGAVSVGFATDAGLIPDPEPIVAGFNSELGQLLTSAQSQAV